MRNILRNALLLLSTAFAVAHAEPGAEDSTPSIYDSSHVTSTESRTSLAASEPVRVISNGTCHTGTVNYITRTLPQQCLRTGRGPSTATAAQELVNDLNRTTVSVTASASNPAQSIDDLLSSKPDSNDSANSSSVTTAPEALMAAPSPVQYSAIDTGPSAATNSTVKASGLPTETSQAVDSPLDNVNFLSFDEWKKQNLEKAGQSAEHVGQARQIPVEGRQRPIHNALDSLGEESEIDLDFTGFGGPSNVQKPKSSDTSQIPSAASHAPASEQSSPATELLRSKDAGKTCKERSNYASFDCAATILKSNSECKSASSVLVENKDSYMLNTCSATNKFFIVELCNDILIDTIVLANFEFFSSIFRHFRVSVSDRYPVKAEKWRDLGIFEARNAREVQAFLIENPLIWARYLRIEFLTHYGNEYYCPVSLLRVHGKTMMQEFRQQEELARGELSDDESTLEPEPGPASISAQGPEVSLVEVAKTEFQPSPKADTTAPPTLLSTESEHSALTSSAAEKVDKATIASNETDICPRSRSDYPIPTYTEMICAFTSADVQNNATTRSSTIIVETGTAESNVTKASSVSESSLSKGVGHTSPPTADNPHILASRDAANSSSAGVSNADESTAESTVSDPVANATSTLPTTDADLRSTLQPNSTSASVTANSTKIGITASTTSQQPQPSTQESFFKSIHKRLQQLESNSTLSLQYIEEQSRILRDAFSKVEKRQVATTASFLSQINETVMNELHGFRAAYDQLWQSTVIELEGQREQYQREMLGLSTRLTLIADELLWQKRMGVVQSTLLLLCLGLVLFARQSSGGFEMPLMQQMMHKSQAALRSGWESPPNSGSPDSRSPVSMFRRKLWRSSAERANGFTTDEAGSRPPTRDGPGVHLEPPTPPQESDHDSRDGRESNMTPDDAENESQSGPATPDGTREDVKRPPSWPDGYIRSGSPLRYG